MDAEIVSGPHAHAPASITRTMVLVMVALLPATAFGLFLFGWPALNLWLATIGGAVVFEAACLNLGDKPIGRYLKDGSAVLTGWLLAMTLPPWAPWWIGVVGAAIAIVIGKHAFGGIGQNLFNPAMVGRVALLVAFPLEMTTFVSPAPMSSPDAPGAVEAIAITLGAEPDAISSATPLAYAKTELGRGQTLEAVLPSFFDPVEAALGFIPGSMGETSSVLILLGGLLLLYKRIITWHVPVSMLAALWVLPTIFHAFDPAHYPSPLFHVVSGATLLGAFFIATDLVTSPVTGRGQLIFGAGCGALVYVIRTWAAYPEGLAFAIVIMNSLTPLIDRYVRPRVYGRDRSGDPIVYAGEKGATS